MNQVEHETIASLSHCLCLRTCERRLFLMNVMAEVDGGPCPEPSRQSPVKHIVTSPRLETYICVAIPESATPAAIDLHQAKEIPILETARREADGCESTPVSQHTHRRHIHRRMTNVESNPKVIWCQVSAHPCTLARKQQGWCCSQGPRSCSHGTPPLATPHTAEANTVWVLS